MKSKNAIIGSTLLIAFVYWIAWVDTWEHEEWYEFPTAFILAIFLGIGGAGYISKSIADALT